MQTLKNATFTTLSPEEKVLEITACRPCNPFLRLHNDHARHWQQDNAEFIAAYNQTITDEGLPLNTWRSF